MPMSAGILGHAWTRSSILANAPNSSGVYAIHDRQVWIYLEKTGYIEASLLSRVILYSGGPCRG
jgi:hypothetical protein